MVGYVATGIIFAVLESPKSFTGTRHVKSCLIIILGQTPENGIPPWFRATKEYT